MQGFNCEELLYYDYGSLDEETEQRLKCRRVDLEELVRSVSSPLVLFSAGIGGKVHWASGHMQVCSGTLIWHRHMTVCFALTHENRTL